MARKTKSTAAAEIASATTASDPGSASTKPRKRKTSASTAAPVLSAIPDTDGGATTSATAEKPINGKLGLIASAVSNPKGASIDDLTKATGWQRHTVRAALTRLRQRGIDAKLTTVDDRKVYRVAEAGA